jgi:hypothetical protein
MFFLGCGLLRATDSNPTSHGAYVRSSDRTAAGISLHLRPLDARPRGTGRNGRGRLGTAEAADRMFAHVAADERDQAVMGRDSWGDGRATCKSLALPTRSAEPLLAA